MERGTLLGRLSWQIGEVVATQAETARTKSITLALPNWMGHRAGQHVDVHLLDAVVRLTRLLDAPAEAPVLLPLLTREIIYRLLMGEQGGRLHHLAILGATPPPSPERSNDPVKTSTSHCTSRASRASWA